MKILAIKVREHGGREVIFDQGDDVYFRPGQFEALVDHLKAPKVDSPQERADRIIRLINSQGVPSLTVYNSIVAEIRADREEMAKQGR